MSIDKHEKNDPNKRERTIINILLLEQAFHGIELKKMLHEILKCSTFPAIRQIIVQDKNISPSNLVE